jgi:hypothetical protein
MPNPNTTELFLAQAEVLSAIACLQRSYALFPANVAAHTNLAVGIADQMHTVAANLRMVAGAVDIMAASIEKRAAEVH